MDRKDKTALKKNRNEFKILKIIFEMLNASHHNRGKGHYNYEYYDVK